MWFRDFNCHQHRAPFHVVVQRERRLRRGISLQTTAMPCDHTLAHAPAHVSTAWADAVSFGLYKNANPENFLVLIHTSVNDKGNDYISYVRSCVLLQRVAPASARPVTNSNSDDNIATKVALTITDTKQLQNYKLTKQPHSGSLCKFYSFFCYPIRKLRDASALHLSARTSLRQAG